MTDALRTPPVWLMGLWQGEVLAEVGGAGPQASTALLAMVFGEQAAVDLEAVFDLADDDPVVVCGTGMLRLPGVRVPLKTRFV